jgi:acyl-CoA thioesterase FadM
MEVCEHELFRALRIPMMDTTPEGVRLGWPRREATCSFLRPLRCGDLVRVTATIAELGNTHATYDFVFEKDRAGRWTEVARGRMTTVHVRQDPAGRMEAEPIPAPTRTALSAG